MGLTNEELKALDIHIEQKFQKMFKEEINRYGNMHGWDAKVSSVNGDGTINVILITDPSETIIPSLINNTGVTLVGNDEVQIYSISSLKNAVVSLKK